MQPLIISEGARLPRTVPEGWTLQPLGDWNGCRAMVAFDPRRHQILVAPGTTSGWHPDFAGRNADVVRALTETGWEAQAIDYTGRRSLWVRDLVDVARSEVPPPGRVVAAEPIGLG
jgi:hypothetical protein